MKVTCIAALMVGLCDAMIANVGRRVASRNLGMHTMRQLQPASNVLPTHQRKQLYQITIFVYDHCVCQDTFLFFKFFECMFIGTGMLRAFSASCKVVGGDDWVFNSTKNYNHYIVNESSTKSTDFKFKNEL